MEIVVDIGILTGLLEIRECDARNSLDFKTVVIGRSSTRTIEKVLELSSFDRGCGEGSASDDGIPKSATILESTESSLKLTAPAIVFPNPRFVMFGCVVAGRPLQTNLQQVDETHALFELPNASTINHLCVFLLGTVPFPEGYGATVHFHWPEKGFQLLGMLSNDKPSAIFRLRGTFTPGASAGPVAFAGGANPTLGGDVTAILGIAIEPLSQIAPMLPDPGSTTGNGAVVAATRAADPGHLAEQVVKHLFNFISSFVGSGVVDENTLVPMRAIVRWYEGFKTKLKNIGPGFLDRAAD